MTCATSALIRRGRMGVGGDHHSSSVSASFRRCPFQRERGTLHPTQLRGTVARMPLVSLDRISIAYGHLPLLDETSLQLDPGERVSLIGRNGAGKSTLLRILGR